jgi:uncharacterized repeat protein (TIGR03803 family)
LGRATGTFCEIEFGPAKNESVTKTKFEVSMKIKIVFCCLLLSLIANAQTFKFSTLYSFKNNGTDPTNPEAQLIVDSSGNLYGTSNGGGTFNLGTVFKISKSGKLTVLHNFQGGTSDGELPQASLTRDSAGNLYGSTAYGGEFGDGILFKINTSNQETVLFSGFNGFGTDGGQPNNVVRDSAGNLYGTAVLGGTNGGGVAFKLDTKNNFTVLFNFCSAVSQACAEDGETPLGMITAGGNYYFPTYGPNIGYGTVDEITPGGVLTVLHTFGASGDGFYPGGSLRQDSKGNLYGVTQHGGTNDPNGTGNGGIVFKQPESGGPETILYNFGSLPNCADGCYPIGPVAVDKTGNVYGIAFTGTGTTAGQALVWEVNTAGKETILHTFAKGVSVYGSVITDTAGNLYGVTDSGGPANLGGVYKLTLQ